MIKRKECDRNRLIQFLLKPLSYPYKARKVKHIQTHISDVFIAPPFVYKVKKPVDFGFLDFTTLKKRKLYCEKEVELNRRLCDIYIGVEEISKSDGAYKFGKGDTTIEYAVKMKRLSDRYFLKNLIHTGKVGLDDLRRIIKKLVEFYKSQGHNVNIDHFGRPENIKSFIYGNISLIKHFIGNTISSATHEAIKFYNDMFFERYSSLFQERIEKGFIKDCHGDLHLNNINITPDYVCIHDCIEFNDKFRFIDIASDIAFLAMDLDFNGRRDFAAFVVSEISKRMSDDTIFEVIDFYKCYRAVVRGKVESLKSGEANIPKREVRASHKRATDYFRLSLQYALFGSRPSLIVIFGTVGTGKSTLAELISRELDCDVISSDRTRKEMLGIAPTERRYEPFDKGIYSEGTTDRVYNEIIKMGKRAAESGNTAILDASFSKKRHRKLLIKAAESFGIPLFFIQTKASDKTVRERLLRREAIGESISDARLELFESFKKGFEEPRELPRKRYLSVSTDKAPELVLGETLEGLIGKNLREVPTSRRS
jgi:aminoglycoside phosphotransferase family enzyme/predicted kinase